MKNSIKIIIAREFLYLLGTLLLFLILLFTWVYLHKSNEENAEKIQNEISDFKKIEKLPIRLKTLHILKKENFFTAIPSKRQKLFDYLIQNEYTNKDFYTFSQTYKLKEKFIPLYQWLNANDITDLNQEQFYARYFGDLSISDKMLDSTSFISELKIDSTLVNTAHNYILTKQEYNIPNSKKYFHEKILNDDNSEEYLNEIQTLEKRLKTIRSSFFSDSIDDNNIKNLIIILILVLFCFRYLYYTTKWSIIQLKIKE